MLTTVLGNILAIERVDDMKAELVVKAEDIMLETTAYRY